MRNESNLVKEEKTVEQKEKDDWETVAWISPKMVYNPETGSYTDEESTKVIQVRTHNDNTEKPLLIGYIMISTLEKFMKGHVKAVPIKIPRKE